MSLTNLLDKVVERTHRPDVRNTIALDALNDIVLEICTNEDWPEDLLEATLLNPLGEGTVVLPLDELGGVRKIEYLVTSGGQKLQSISPRNAIQASGCALVDCFYQSGNTLVINSRLGFSQLRVGYYPDIPWISQEPGKDQHWLLTRYLQLLINGVVARVFMATGDDTSAGYYEQLYIRQRANIRASRAELG